MAVVTAENKLAIRPVTVARATRDEVMVSRGVATGERVLATALAVITEGMEVNPVAPPGDAKTADAKP